VASIHQNRNSADANQAAPRTLAHEYTEFGLFEEPGKGIAAGTGKFIGEHHFGAIDAGVWSVFDVPVAWCPVGLNVTGQYFNKVVGHLAAAIEALVNDRALFFGLRAVVTIEVGKASSARIRQLDVVQLAARKLVNLFLVAFDPVNVA